MKRLLALALVGVLGGGAGAALAGTISIGSGTGPLGGGATTPAQIAVTYTSGDNTNGYQVHVDFDNTQLSVTAVAASGASCGEPVPGAGRVIVFNSDTLGGVLASGVQCNLTFTVLAAATAGAKTLDVNVAQPGDGCFDAPLANPTACAEVDGTITVQAGPAPIFTSSPEVPGGTINLFANVGANSTHNLTVTNTGNATLNISAVGGLSAPLSVSAPGGNTGAIAAAGSKVYTITCAPTNTTLASQTLSFTDDAAGSPQTYTVTCQGNAGTYTSNPAPGGTFTFTSNVGVAATTQVLQIGNSGNTAIQVGPPAIGGGNGPFTVTPNTGTIPVAAGAANADTYTIGCTPTAVGLVTKTLTIPVSGDPARTSATYTLSCTGNGAKLSSNPPPGGTLTLTGNPSALLNGNISVTNSGNQDLTVTGCNAPAGFTVDTTAVALVTPGATVNITVSCTAPATQGATVSADLICTTTNDPTLPTGVTYHLSCNALVLSIPAMSAAGKGLLVMLVLGLGLLGFRMRRQSA